MYASTDSTPRWLLIDASHAGTMRFATAEPGPRPRINPPLTISTDGLPTFTDALQTYERESGTALRGTECVLAMAGAVSGEIITMVRSKWTLSRAGLSAMFGRPVQIINDTVARAWAIRSNTMTSETLRGVGNPDLRRPGRYLLLLVEEGVGAAVIDIDRSGEMRVLETEAGHMDFAPVGEREEQLAKALRGPAPLLSWQSVLTAEPGDPRLLAGCAGMVEPDRQKLLAGALGRYVVNLVHAYGAWQGVLLTGSRAQKLIAGANRIAFDMAFGQRRDFSRLLVSCPAWRIEQREAVLAGGAELLAHNSHDSALARAA